MQPGPDEITLLLAGWQSGDRAALDRLMPLIRRELHVIARRHLQREANQNYVQPSSLVQEAFVRLLPGQNAGWQNRTHFFAAASTVMRHVLVDHARQRSRTKRGGAAIHVGIDAAAVLSPGQVDEVVAIDMALEHLAEIDQRKCRVFEMRFFGGLSIEETAAALNIAPNTVIRDWNFARAWLRRELTGEGGADRGAATKD